MDAFQALLNAAAEMPRMEAETTSNNSLDNNNNNNNGHPQTHAGTTSTAPKRLPLRKRPLYDMLSELVRSDYTMFYQSSPDPITL